MNAGNPHHASSGGIVYNESVSNIDRKKSMQPESGIILTTF